MNQQTISAFTTFNTSLSNAINTLQDSLQQTNSFNSIYTEQFNDIIKFQENTKAFTRFLQDQNEYHKKQYLQFKSKLNEHTNQSTKLQPLNTVSSQLSIQSTPQSLNDWSYTANDRISTGSIPDYQRWRGYDPQPNNYNDYLFNEVDIERIPFKVIDTDNDSDGTNFVPSLPPSITSPPPSIENGDIKDDIYDVADGIEDDEKWDSYPLIKTEAFTGFFESGTDRLEFKNDKVLKPPPTKWQEREEQNRQIINTLLQSLQQQNVNHENKVFMFNHENINVVDNNEECVEDIIVGTANDNSGSTSTSDSTCDIDTVTANDSVMSMNSMGSMRYVMSGSDNDNNNHDIDAKLDEIIDDDKANIIGMKRRRSMCMLPCIGTGTGVDDNTTDTCSSGAGLISNNISFIKGQQPPITFIQYEPPKSIVSNIEQHPHYHPVIHGNGNDNKENNNEETCDIHGEISAPETDQISDCIHELDNRYNEHNGISQHCNIKQHKQLFIDKNMNVNDINKEIVTLRNVLDHHFNINHNDLNQVKEAIYSL
eukprot:966311_1